MLSSIRPYLAKFLRRPGFSSKIQEADLCSRWDEIIENVHKSAKGKSRALYVTGQNELVVRVADPLWLQEIAFSREEIMKRVKTECQSIKSIRFVA
jgi:hypothetical protein